MSSVWLEVADGFGIGWLGQLLRGRASALGRLPLFSSHSGCLSQRWTRSGCLPTTKRETLLLRGYFAGVDGLLPIAGLGKGNLK